PGQQLGEPAIGVAAVVQPGQWVPDRQLTEVVAASPGLSRAEDRVQGTSPTVAFQSPQGGIGRVERTEGLERLAIVAACCVQLSLLALHVCFPAAQAEPLDELP